MSVTLKAEQRSEVGTNRTRALRKTGQVPCVIYGHGEGTVSASVSEHELELVLHQGERLLMLEIEGKEQSVILKDVQYDTFGRQILHADFIRVDLTESVNVTVAIVLRGTPTAAAGEGVTLQQTAADVELACPANAIPEEIRISVTEMAIGDSLHMSDLGLPEGATLVSPADAVVCTLSQMAEEVEEEAEEGEGGTGDEPEVIGAKEDDEDEKSAD